MRSYLAVWICVSVVSPGIAQEWREFRGPNGSGVSSATGLPEVLDPELNIAWRTEIPKGYSSPVVSGERIYLTAYEERHCFTLALDRSTGEILWKVEAPAVVPENRRTPNSPASSTPVTDGERVIVAYECYGLVGYDTAGKELWKEELAPFNIPHGLATSPVLAGENVVMLVDQDTDSYIVAFDKKSGEERWRVARRGATHGYSTPVVHRPKEGPAEVIVSGSFEVTSYSADDGSKLWWANGMCWQAKTLPVIEGDMLYVLSTMGGLAEYGGAKLKGTWEEMLADEDADGDGRLGRKEWTEGGTNMLWFLYDMDNDEAFSKEEFEQTLARERSPGGLFAIQLGGTGDVTKTHVRWTNTDRRNLPDLPSPVLHEGVLYLMRDNGVLTSMDPADGKSFKNERAGDPDEYSASPIIGEGKMYCAGHSGQLLVVRCGKEWELLSSKSLDEEVWATPAIADGQVLVRTEDALYSFIQVDG